MFIEGQPYEGTDLWLIGISVTVTLTMLVGLAQGPFRFSSPIFQTALAVIYLPLCAVGVDLLPTGIVPTFWGGLTVFLLASGVLVLTHGRIYWQLANRIPSSSDALSVEAHFSSADYHEEIVAAESKAFDLAFIQQRIAPYFLSRAGVEHVARDRFGEGNKAMDQYLEDYRRRQNAFYSALQRGARVRELYPRDRLIQYVKNGSHDSKLWPLPPSLVVDQLQNWSAAILKYPNYFVGISDESLPLKYHLIDLNSIHFHEPIPRGDPHRLNSLSVYSAQLGKSFQDDFDFIWALVSSEWRDSQLVASWVEHHLIPLALKRRTRNRNGSGPVHE